MKKYFIFNILIITSLLLFIFCTCSKDKTNSSINDNLLSTKSDTEQAKSIIEEYYHNYENKKIDSILKLYSKNYDSSLYSKDYFESLFNSVDKIKFNIDKKELKFLDNEKIEIKIQGSLIMKFKEIDKTNNYGEKYILIKEDGLWKIYKRMMG